jgi:predicted permease
MPAEHPTSLPAPAGLSGWLLRLAWREDAPAVSGDLAEALGRSERGRIGRWWWGWGQVVRAVAHGFRSEAHRRGPTLRLALAIRLAMRGLVRDPGTSLAASGSLALGLASAATFFAILNGLDRPLPVPEGDRIVRIDVVQPMQDGRAVTVTGADLQAWRDTPALAGIGGSRSFPATVRDPGRIVVRLQVAAITPAALELLAVPPVSGHVPEGAEAEGAILMQASLFEEFFGAEVEGLGRLIEVDGVPGVVSAVVPDDFGFPLNHRIWVVERAASHLATRYDPVGRLTNGSTLESAAQQMQPRWASRDPQRPPDDGAGIVRVREYTKGRGESGELVLFAGLVLIGVSLLLIACANAATLLLVRASERVHVLGVQAALGASRLQIAVQLLLESLGLAALGGLVGLGLATAMANHVQRTMGPENFGYYWTRVAVDGPVVLFTAGLIVGAALVAGVAPVVRILRGNLHAVLKSGGGAGSVRAGWAGRAFLGAQLALSCAALAAAGLTARSMSAAKDFGRALPGDEVVMGTVVLDGDDARARSEGLRRVLAAATSIEGARTTAVALGAPGFREPWGTLELDGAEASPEAPRLAVSSNAVGLNYFTLFDLELRAGRGFSDADTRDAEPVAVVSEAFVARYWPTGTPLGRRVRVTALGGTSWTRVVGVVEDAELGSGPRMREERVYRPLAQVDPEHVMILARAAYGDGEGLTGALRASMAHAAPDLALASVRTLSSGHAFMTRAQSTFSLLAFWGGASGLLVAVVGLYALLAFRVRQRRRELGVRKALGADGPTLVREILVMALRQLAPATAVGLAGAWLAAPVLGSILLGGDPRSPLVFGATAVTFIGAGLLAALVPALRAGRVEPASVLRSE